MSSHAIALARGAHLTPVCRRGRGSTAKLVVPQIKVMYAPPYAVRSVTKLTIVKMAHFVPNFHKFLGDHRYYRPSFKLPSNVAPKVRLSSQTSDCRPNSSTTVDCRKQPSTFIYKYSTAICEHSTVVRKHSTVVREHSMLIHEHSGCSQMFDSHSQVVHKCSTIV